MEITLLLTKEKCISIREQDFLDQIVKKIEMDRKNQYDLNVINDYLYLVPDMLKCNIDRYIRVYKDSEHPIYSLKDRETVIREINTKVLHLQREIIKKHIEDEEEESKREKAYRFINSLPKSQQYALGPLWVESIDENGITFRHKNGQVYEIKEIPKDRYHYFDFSIIKENLPFLKDLRFYINLKHIEESLVVSESTGIKITPDNGPSLFIPLDREFDFNYDTAILSLTYNGVIINSINI